MKVAFSAELDLGGLEKIPLALFKFLLRVFHPLAERVRVRYYLWRYAYQPGGAVDRVTGLQTPDNGSRGPIALRRNEDE